MKIAAIQKTTLIDFPGRVSAIIFTQGCNFNCPYCHNKELIPLTGKLENSEDVLKFLKKRSPLLQGVVVTGGEPTIQKGLIKFLGIIKSMGYDIKLDTNGSNPKILEEVIKLGLVDYIALDIKAALNSLPNYIYRDSFSSRILESLSIIADGSIEHEVRITCAYPFINKGIFMSILDVLSKNTPIYLQKVILSNVLDESFFDSYLPMPDVGILESWSFMAKELGFDCKVRI